MGCRYYNRISMAKGDSIKTMEELAKQGNKNIKGLVNKDIVIKRRRYK